MSVLVLCLAKKEFSRGETDNITAVLTIHRPSKWIPMSWKSRVISSLHHALAEVRKKSGNAVLLSGHTWRDVEIVTMCQTQERKGKEGNK